MKRIAFLIAAAYWFLEASIDALVFGQGTFVGRLLPGDPNEIWMRLFVGGLLIAFGAYADISIRRLKESERERQLLHQRLEEALASVLGGFIPICAQCKSIRADDDRWVQVEVYVRDRTQAEFSHTLCPPCMKKLYPQYRSGASAGPPPST